MVILDANILIYAYNHRAPQHEVVRAWLETVLGAEDPIGLPWSTIWAFLRVVTNSRISPNPMEAGAAFRIVKSWLGLSGVIVVAPGPRHAELLERVVVESRAIGPLLSDAALAALAIEYGATLASTDRDFARFGELRWINPLA